MKTWTKEELKREWIKGLKGGEYKQCQGVIVSNEGDYCCLGVLACVFHEKRITYNDHLLYTKTDTNGYSIAERYFDDHNQFLRMNDFLKMNFNEIAAEVGKL